MIIRILYLPNVVAASGFGYDPIARPVTGSRPIFRDYRSALPFGGTFSSAQNGLQALVQPDAVD